MRRPFPRTNRSRPAPQTVRKRRNALGEVDRSAHINSLTATLQQMEEEDKLAESFGSLSVSQGSAPPTITRDFACPPPGESLPTKLPSRTCCTSPMTPCQKHSGGSFNAADNCNFVVTSAQSVSNTPVDTSASKRISKAVRSDEKKLDAVTNQQHAAGRGIAKRPSGPGKRVKAESFDSLSEKLGGLWLDDNARPRDSRSAAPSPSPEAKRDGVSADDDNFRSLVRARVEVLRKKMDEDNNARFGHNLATIYEETDGSAVERLAVKHPMSSSEPNMRSMITQGLNVRAHETNSKTPANAQATCAMTTTADSRRQTYEKPDRVQYWFDSMPTNLASADTLDPPNTLTRSERRHRIKKWEPAAARCTGNGSERSDLEDAARRDRRRARRIQQLRTDGPLRSPVPQQALPALTVTAPPPSPILAPQLPQDNEDGLALLMKLEADPGVDNRAGMSWARELRKSNSLVGQAAAPNGLAIPNSPATPGQNGVSFNLLKVAPRITPSD